MNVVRLSVLALLTGTTLFASDVAAQTIPALRVVEVGDEIQGVAITNLNEPHINDDGVVGFGGVLADNDRFIWYDDGPVWRNSDEDLLSLGGAEVCIGIGDAGEFVYSTSINSNDGIWTHNGMLTREHESIPGFSDTTISTFHSRPTMIGSGQSFWVAGFNENGGSSTLGRVLLTSLDNQFGSFFPILRSDDVLEGLAISASGIDFDYDISANSFHHIHVLTLDTGTSTDDGVIYVDGAIAARESMSNGGGDNWDNFDLVSINNAGNFLFTGDTDGSQQTDEFIAYNGAIVLREGDTVAGVELKTGAVLRFAALNNDESAVYGWDNGNTEYVFFTCDANNFVSTSKLVLEVGADGLDFDQDNNPDAQVTAIRATTLQGQAVSLGDDGALFLELEIDDGMAHEAIVRLDLPSCCGDGIVQGGREDCDDANADDTDVCPSNCKTASCGDGFILEGEEACDDGNEIETDACTASCTLAACGDGIVWEGVEACDDGNDDDSDDCLQSCEAASCGDGVVHIGFESCDDGNTESGDGCDANCLIENESDTEATETSAGPTDSDTDSDTDDTDNTSMGSDSDTDMPTQTGDPTDATTDPSDSDSETTATDTSDTTDTTGTTDPTDTKPTGPGTSGSGGDETSEGSTTDGDSTTGASEDPGCDCHSTDSHGQGFALMLALAGLLRRRKHSPART